MKHAATIGISLLVAVFVLSSVCFAQNFPAPPSQSSPPQGPTAVQQQMYYGYVPSPPIRHTWPGGYRVIFHELVQTLSNHMIGHY